MDLKQLQLLKELEEWTGLHPYPAVLKVDGSWGGTGVKVVHDWAEARGAYRRLLSPNRLGALKRLVVNRDPYMLAQQPSEKVLTAQEFVDGRPANCMVACWKGEVLGIVSVEALSVMEGVTGAATIVRVIENDEMTSAAVAIVRRLNLSGYCGFDFMIEKGSGAAYLIEMNPRATQLGHLELGRGRNLTAALFAAVTGQEPVDAGKTTEKDMIALFPQAWEWTPEDPLLAVAFHDIPAQDSELYVELSKASWPNRSLLARIDSRLRGKQAPIRRGSL